MSSKEILKAQGEDASFILNRLGNIRKDGPKRWAQPEYAAKQGKILGEVYERFKHRHEKIKGESNFAGEPYLIYDGFGVVDRQYQALLAYLEEMAKLAKLDKPFKWEEVQAGVKLSGVEVEASPRADDLLPFSSTDRATETVVLDKISSAKETLMECLSVYQDLENIDPQAAIDKVAFYLKEYVDTVQAALINLPKEVASTQRKEFLRLEMNVTKTLADMRAKSTSFDPLEGTSSKVALEVVQSNSMPTESQLDLEDKTTEEPARIAEAPASDDATVRRLFELLGGHRRRERRSEDEWDSDDPDSYDDSIKPRVKLPKFSGSDQSEWIGFHDMFMTTVHKNKKFTNSAKMTLLKSHLTGKALSKIAHVPNAGCNYTRAWNLILERYHCPSELIGDKLDELLDLKPVQFERSALLADFVDSVKSIILALENYEMEFNNFGNSMVVHILMKKLPSDTKKAFGTPDRKNYPLLKDVLSFLDNRVWTLANAEKEEHPKNNRFVKSHAISSSISNSDPKKQAKKVNGCVYCGGNHRTFTCNKLKNMTPAERSKAVNGKKLCRVCLSDRHSVSDCSSPYRCTVDNCGERHAAILHPAGPSVNTCQVEESFNGMIPTARLTLTGPSGNTWTARCLLDQGSMKTFMSEKLVKRLALVRKKSKVDKVGIGGEHRPVKGQVKCFLPFKMGRSGLEVSALVVPFVSTTFSFEQLPEYSSWDLADPEYFEGGEIDMIIGSDYYPHVILQKMKKGKLLAQKTEFGWVLSGANLSPMKNPKPTSHTIVPEKEDDSVDLALRKFWETEEKIQETPNWTKEEEAAEQFYQDTTTRDDNGRYVVGLPLKQHWEFGRSKHIAIGFMKQLERKFEFRAGLKEEYSNAIQDYLDQGHARLATEPESKFRIVDGDKTTYNCFYLPHLAVFKESSASTKTRIVFHASSKSDNKTSLNDHLLVGPTIQRDIIEKVMNFRMNKLVFVCDVQKMYRQIKVRESDQDLQRFVWRTSPSEPLRDYVLTTVTFGEASAPFMAIRTLKQIADDHEASHPVAAAILRTDCYVDDIHFGSCDIDGIVRGRDELIDVLRGAGFELRKWSANRADILLNIPSGHVSASPSVGFMGMTWNSNEDEFSYPPISFSPITDKLTKRQCLSEIAKVFDPMGFCQPVIVPAKLLMQSLWKTALKWDDSLDEGQVTDWFSIRAELERIENLIIPRHIFADHHNENLEIHGFSDASGKAYGCSIYLVSTDLDGKRRSHLILAKSRVAPVKELTIPRLELKGAQVLSEMLAKVSNLFQESIRLHGWVDSKVALHWITGSPEKWKPFVRHRVNQIRATVPGITWGYVPTLENPADLVSRGCSFDELHDSQLWWNGPPWLTNGCIPEPFDKKMALPDVITAEQEMLKTVCNVTAVSSSGLIDIISRFSCYDRMIRVVALVRRWSANRKAGQLKVFTKFPTCSECRESEIMILREVQRNAFATEIKDIIGNGQVSSTSKLAKLTPQLDNTGVLRILGRIKNAAVPFTRQHPIILPPYGHVTELAIQRAHRHVLHGGADQTLNATRSFVWIINGKQRVRAILSHCVLCRKAHPRCGKQLMGQLPPERVQFSHIFQNSGCDFAGPILLKPECGRRGTQFKAYICVFVCMATRAIHLELVGSLSADSFIACLKRFTSKHKEVQALFSDNGRNFVASFVKIKDLQARVAARGLTWSFIPPGSPHFGGLWEAGVKSCKTHLKKVLSPNTYTWEEMETILCQVTACLNNRPICPLSDDPEEREVLTPNHFLRGSCYFPVAERNLQGVKLTTLNRWQFCDHQYQEIVKRYKAEYLSRMQVRNKWSQLATYSLKSSVEEYQAKLMEMAERQNSLIALFENQTRVMEHSAHVIGNLNIKTSKMEAANYNQWSTFAKEWSTQLVRMDFEELLQLSASLVTQISSVMNFHPKTDDILARIDLSSLTLSHKWPFPLTPQDMATFETSLIRGDELIFLFSVPVVSLVSLLLYRVVAIPVPKEDYLSWAIPQTEWIAINETTSVIRSVDMDSCRLVKHLHVCRATPDDLDAVRTRCCRAAWNQEVEDPCAYSTSSSSNVVIPLDSGTWAFVAATPLLLDEQTLLGSGLFSETPIQSTNSSLIITDSALIYPLWARNGNILANLTKRDKIAEEIDLEVGELNDETRTLKEYRMAPAHIYVLYGTSGVSVTVLLIIVAILLFRRLKTPSPGKQFKKSFGLV